MNIKNFKQFEATDYHNSKGGKYWGDTGAGVLVLSKSTKRFLISMRSKFVNEPHTYGIIGGMADGTDFKEDALRELDEETGYTGDIEMKDLSVFSNPTFKYTTFLGIIDEEFEPISHPYHAHENDFFTWLTFDELLDIEPKHFGLKYTLDKCKNILKSELSKL